MTHPLAGTPKSPEHREKIATANRAKARDPKFIQKLKDAHDRQLTHTCPCGRTLKIANYKYHMRYCGKSCTFASCNKPQYLKLLCESHYSVYRLAKMHNVTFEWLASFIAQSDYLCQICGKRLKAHSSRTHDTACIDHCHSSGRVRGVLCQRCNSVLGRAQDSVSILRNATRYLHDNRDWRSSLDDFKNDRDKTRWIESTCRVAGCNDIIVKRSRCIVHANERVQARKWRMTVERWRAFIAYYDEKCKICSQSKNHVRLEVDHSHESGAVRGLLCINCNSMLGFVADSSKLLNSAIMYLEIT